MWSHCLTVWGACHLLAELTNDSRLLRISVHWKSRLPSGKGMLLRPGTSGVLPSRFSGSGCPCSTQSCGTCNATRGLRALRAQKRMIFILKADLRVLRDIPAASQSIRHAVSKLLHSHDRGLLNSAATGDLYSMGYLSAEAISN